ncbi:hypothetical protein SASPL_128021 [Salvia splendens]|uniref:Uncharacterized protein n=1 Tax=Salvia splendens TaxID=180675 RepID=A0A8X8ZM41_SALSN|nr:uncharacterized protein LOC121751408 [Salvia splendens]KAG6409977.1 hypothetical protein SASPL_128021 [Salvia splendens]
MPRHRNGGDRACRERLSQQQQQLVVRQQQQQKRQMLQSGGARVEAEEKPPDGDDSSLFPTLFVPRSVTNLDRLMESVAPFIEARYSPEVYARGFETTKVDSRAFFYLEDLWESFSEWSVYGRGVPLLLRGGEPIQQYYVPSLSGIQLHIHPSKASSTLTALMITAGCGNWEVDKGDEYVFDLHTKQLSRVDNADSPGQLSIQFFERDLPHDRRPLSNKMSLLASPFPELSKIRSCDLLPTSWISVAWYPIYRIPVGSTMQDSQAAFLTFHSLSTQSKSSSASPKFHQANTRTVCGFVDPTARISLPVFALASYKLKGSIFGPRGTDEWEQEKSLSQAAENWLKCVQVELPDYMYFRRRSSGVMF